MTDLLLRRVAALARTLARRVENVRHGFARELIADFEAGDFIGVGQRLQSPPADGADPDEGESDRVDRRSRLCGFMEYDFIYAYNDFSRYGGVFTNEHEGDNEGCCVVFERLALQDLQTQNGDPPGGRAARA